MSPEPAPARRASAGFTLLELLVALTVAGLVVSAVHLVVSTALDSVERNREAQERSRTDRNATALLAGLLRSARLDLARAPDGFRTPEAGGSPSGADELVFASSLGHPVGRLARGERVRVHLWLRPEGARPGAALLALAPLSGREPRTDTLVLFPEVTGLRTRFRARPGAPWTEAWSQRARLPATIRVDFASPRALPPLVATLPLAGGR